VAFGDAERAHDLPGGEVARRGVEHLALLDEELEALERVFERRVGVVVVEVEDVDAIRVQAAQAGLDGSHEVKARGAPIGRRLAGGEVRLGGDHQLVAVAFDELAQDALGLAARVDVRRVEEVDARVAAALIQRA